MCNIDYAASVPWVRWGIARHNTISGISDAARYRNSSAPVRPSGVLLFPTPIATLSDLCSRLLGWPFPVFVCKRVTFKRVTREGHRFPLLAAAVSPFPPTVTSCTQRRAVGFESSATE